MSLITMLNAAQGGRLFATVGQRLGVSESETQAAMAALAPVIAARLHDTAAADATTHDTLLDLLDDNGGAVSLDDPEAITSGEAMADGNAMLDDIYGSRPAALAALGRAAPSLNAAQLGKLAPVTAAAVVTALAQSQAQAPARLAGGGLLGTIATELLKGLVQGAARSLAPKRRRRRRTTSYWGTARSRRKTTRRKTRRRTPLEEIFGAILGTRR